MSECTCRETLVDYVLRRVSHPYRACPFYGTFTPLAGDDCRGCGHDVTVHTPHGCTLTACTCAGFEREEES